MKRPARRSPRKTKPAATRSPRENTSSSRMRSRRHRDREHPYDRDRQLRAARADRSALLRHPYYITPSEPVGQEAFAVIRDAMRRKPLRVDERLTERVHVDLLVAQHHDPAGFILARAPSALAVAAGVAPAGGHFPANCVNRSTGPPLERTVERTVSSFHGVPRNRSKFGLRTHLKSCRLFSYRSKAVPESSTF
jgi:hypothetical protein